MARPSPGYSITIRVSALRAASPARRTGERA
jgi:hypothetical protein